MKLCTAVQEGCGYKDTLRAHRYFAPLAKYFTVCITYQPPLVFNYDNIEVYMMKSAIFFWCLGSSSIERREYFVETVSG